MKHINRMQPLATDPTTDYGCAQDSLESDTGWSRRSVSHDPVRFGFVANQIIDPKI